MALQSAGRLAEARECYRRALAVDPGHARTHNNLGALLHAAGDLEGATGHYERAYALQPDLVEARRNLGVAWCDRGDLQRAARFSRQALELEPDSPELRQQLASILYNLGVELERSERMDEALEHYEQALELRPDFADAALNCGVAHSFKGHAGAALAQYRRAISLRPDFALAHFNLALDLLRSGDYESGWREYEWRWKLPEFLGQRLACEQPHWDGSSLDGKTILLYAEQGFGDAIQFVRYARLVERRGARVLVRCLPQLTALLRNAASVSGVVSDEDEALPHFDVCFPLLSLPLMLNTTVRTIPTEVPYIRAPEDKILGWGTALAEWAGMRRIGLVWGSFTGNERLARRKSVPLELFAAFSGARDAVFFSLQKGPQGRDAAHAPRRLKLVDLAPRLNDFADTAAVIANLDLVISIDSAVAHLAGAMGRPVWTLSALPSDWRWAGQEGGCAWYPSMRIFRQHRVSDWSGPVQDAAEALARWR